MKVLLFDIETTPNLGYTWGKWEQNVMEFVKEWQLLSYSYKWLNKDKILVESQRNQSEAGLVNSLWSLFDEADVVIAHNGDNFDIKKAKTKFVEFGLPPTAPFKSIDTKKLAKRYFQFNSNSLNDLAKYFKIGNKTPHTGFDLWLGCMKGDKKSWGLMEKYNKQDVVLLEKIYLKLRQWDKQHPNLSFDEETLSCPVCCSHKIQKRGFQVAITRKYQRLCCQSCGHWFRGDLV